MRLTPSDLFSIFAAVSYVAGGACMKACDGMQRPLWLVGVYVAFVGGATLQTLAMRGQDLSANYALVLGLEALVAFALGVLAFGEAATAARLLGVVLVTVGIGLLRA